MGGGAQKLTEIDAIFAGRGRGTTASHRWPVQGTTAAPAGPHPPPASGAPWRAPALLKSEPTTTKKNQGKRPATDHDEKAAPVVQDPSQTLPAHRPSDALKKLKRRPNPSDLEERVFHDSRASSRPFSVLTCPFCSACSRSALSTTLHADPLSLPFCFLSSPICRGGCIF